MQHQHFQAHPRAVLTVRPMAATSCWYLQEAERSVSDPEAGPEWPRLQQVSGGVGGLHRDGDPARKREGDAQLVQAMPCKAAAGWWAAQPVPGLAAV